MQAGILLSEGGGGGGKIEGLIPQMQVVGKMQPFLAHQGRHFDEM